MPVKVRKASSQGFSLLEVLIAATIFVVMMFAVEYALLGSTNSIVKARQLSELTRLGQERLAVVRATLEPTSDAQSDVQAAREVFDNMADGVDPVSGARSPAKTSSKGLALGHYKNKAKGKAVGHHRGESTSDDDIPLLSVCEISPVGQTLNQPPPAKQVTYRFFPPESDVEASPPLVEVTQIFSRP